MRPTHLFAVTFGSWFVVFPALSPAQEAPSDGIPAAIDNCPDRYNPAQTDLTGSGTGALCRGSRCEVVADACAWVHFAASDACRDAVPGCRWSCGDDACVAACEATAAACEATAEAAHQSCIQSPCVEAAECFDATWEDFGACDAEAESVFWSCAGGCGTSACTNACVVDYFTALDACAVPRDANQAEVCMAPVACQGECYDGVVACTELDVVCQTEMASCLANCADIEVELPPLPPPPPPPGSWTNICESVVTANSPMGVNLSRVLHFDASQWLLVDAFTQSSPWLGYSPSQGWVQQPGFPIDAEGWPTAVSGDLQPMKLLFQESGAAHPVGTWAIEWDGGGATLEVGGDGHDLRCEDDGPIASCPSRRGTFRVVPSDGGILVRIVPDDPSSYGSPDRITRIRIIMPGGVCGRSAADLDLAEYCATARGGTGTCDSGENCFDFTEVDWNRFTEPPEAMAGRVVFHPRTLALLPAFSTIRFSEPTQINGSSVSSWSQRAMLAQHTYSEGSGLPYEYAIAMANLLGADPWFNIPHLAGEDYVDELAALVDLHLDTTRLRYIEYTNEHWNPSPGFEQSQHMALMATATGIGAELPAHLRPTAYYAVRAAQLVARWRTASAYPDRVVGVLGTHTAVPEYTTAMLSQPGVVETMDAVAVGPYFGNYLGHPQYIPTIAGWNLDDLFEELETGARLQDPDAPQGALAEVFGYLDGQAAALTGSGLTMVAYEGGPGIGGHWLATSAEANNPLFRAANADPRMADLYTALLNRWRAIGGQLFLHFNHVQTSGFSNYGLLSTPADDPSGAPRFSAVCDFIEANPRWWGAP